MTFLTGSRWTSLVIASVVLPSISMANRAFACLSARNVSWPGSDTCSGSEPCPYRTAGIRPARRVRRAAPLPKSVRVVATSLTSDTGTPDEDDDRWGPACWWPRRGTQDGHAEASCPVDHGAGGPVRSAELPQP